MEIEKNISGSEYVEVIGSTAAHRVGRRIREIRTTQGLSQAELGERVGLNADRIQKYENGVRKPKQELLKQIADVLGVETIALTDPVISDHIGAMYAFFEMEDLYKLRLERIEGRMMMYFDEMHSAVNQLLDEWDYEQQYIKVLLEDAESDEEIAAIKKEYKMWKWTFPMALTNRTEKDLIEIRKKRLQDGIEELKRQLADLDTLLDSI